MAEVVPFALNHQDGEDMTPELMQFASVFGLDRAAPGRCCTRLLVHLIRSVHLNIAQRDPELC